MKRILIVGCGPGAADHLTDAARAAVRSAEVLAGSRRLLYLGSKRTWMPPPPLPETPVEKPEPQGLPKP